MYKFVKIRRKERIMRKAILNHYLQSGMYTDAGPYKELYQSLPDDIYELRELVNKQHIHKMSLYRSFLAKNNSSGNLKYKWQNYRCLDDVLLTSTAMTSELFRINGGENKFPENNTDPNKKLVITCRYVSVWYASILKAKGIPCRCRSGFAPYLYSDKIVDHWIVQYYDRNFNKWINVDSQANVKNKDFNVCNFPDDEFIWAADAWLAMRENKLKNKKLFVNGTKHCGDATFALSLLMDFHALFHDEINYVTLPVFLWNSSDDLYKCKKSTLKELDHLARLMQDVDKNFDELKKIWETNKKFRSVASSLNGPMLHLELDKKDLS